MEIAQIVSDRLKAARTAKGWSRAQLAAAVGGTTQRAVEAWEQGKRMPTLDTLARVAEALGVSVGSLVGEPDAVPTAEAVKALLGTEAGADAVLGGLARFVRESG